MNLPQETETFYVPKTIKKFGLTFEVYIFNKAISQKFDGITKHFETVYLNQNKSSCAVDNTVLKVKNGFSITVIWEPQKMDFLEPEIVAKEMNLRKRNAAKDVIKSMFWNFITFNMNAYYRPLFIQSHIKVQLPTDFAAGARYEILYEDEPFGYLLQVEPVVQLPLFK